MSRSREVNTNVERPSSLNSDGQHHTGRRMFKLFEKDPIHLPGVLLTKIYNWLSNSPPETESYIRLGSGCLVLSIYVSMASAAWEKIFVCGINLHGRFVHKNAWRTWSSPELISVSPLAVWLGKKALFILRGRNLTNPGTRIHCTYMGGYSSQEVMGSTNQGTMYDEINLGGFKVQDASPSVLGRFFIEMENGFQGNGFPVIIVDATICEELLESEFDSEAKLCDVISEDQAHDYGRSITTTKEEVLHFLNELGCLFQRKRASSLHEAPDYSFSCLELLLIFSVERGFCALVKALLDIVVERNLEAGNISGESFEMLSEIQLLNRAVKGRCRSMADLLIHYSIISSNDSTMV